MRRRLRKRGLLRRRARDAVVGALAAAVLFCLAACGSDDTAGRDTTFVATAESVSVMDAEPPAGWVEIAQDPDPGIEYLASADGSAGFTGASVRATRIAPDILELNGYWVEDHPDTFDLDAIQRSWLGRTQAYGQNDQVTELPARMIDGNPARGYSYISTREDDTYYEMWIVGRPDGLWRITFNAPHGEDSLPAGLTETFLDSITWATPTGATPSASR